jgi:hypothetical protein
MPHMYLKLSATKYTTREGDHPDDKAYAQQLKEFVIEELTKLGFIRAEVELEFGP